jgi:hypothetical protein
MLGAVGAAVDGGIGGIAAITGIDAGCCIGAIIGIACIADIGGGIVMRFAVAGGASGAIAGTGEAITSVGIVGSATGVASITGDSAAGGAAAMTGAAGLAATSAAVTTATPA